MRNKFLILKSKEDFLRLSYDKLLRANFVGYWTPDFNEFVVCKDRYYGKSASKITSQELSSVYLSQK